MKAILKNIFCYLARLMSDASGDPSAKRYACALFAISSIVFAACGFGAEIVGIFAAAALGENITSVFEKGK